MSEAFDLTSKVPEFQAEKLILGQMMLGSDRGGDKVCRWALANLTAAMFQRPSHRVLFSAIASLLKAGEPVEQNTVEIFLETKNRLADIGGPDYLLHIADYAINASQHQVYGYYVLRDHGLREIQKRTTVLYNFCDTATDLHKALAMANDLTRGLSVCNEDTFDHSGDMDFEETGVRGLSTGLTCIDRHVGEASEGGVGWPVGEMSVIGGGAGHGKSALMITCCAHACRVGRKPAYVTLEMPWWGVRTRFVQTICGWSKAPKVAHIREEYLQACRTVKEWPVVYWDPSKRKAGEKTIETLAAWASQQRDSRGITEIYVDYAQLLNPKLNLKKDNRTRELDYVADELKEIAARVEIPVIVGSQLSMDQKGVMRTKDCIRFEDNAALVVFIHRPKREQIDAYCEPCTLLIKKSRWGITGPESAFFDRRFTRFRDANPKEEPKSPEPDPYEDPTFDEFAD